MKKRSDDKKKLMIIILAVLFLLIILLYLIFFIGSNLSDSGLAASKPGGCSPKPYECSDCIDNDNDGKIDYKIDRRGNILGDSDCISSTDFCERTPTTEICDNKDNDCDGSIDESLTRSCSTSCGGSGIETCISGTWQNCNAPQNGNCISPQVCILEECCLDQNAPFGECDNRNYGLYGAKFYDTSEYLIGKVLIKLFFVESDGTIDANYENWNTSEKNMVLQAVTNAKDWIALQYPYNHLGDRLSFIIESETVNVSYEPIKRAAGPFGYPNGGSNETIWVQEIMNKKGYTTYDYSANKYKTYLNVADYLNNQRQIKNTHWAIAIFAVDSSPANSAFSNGQTNFASGTGGPYTVILDSINSNTAVHEILHTFYAMDQYNQPMYNLSSKQGYLNGQNINYLGAECGGDIMFNLTLNLCNSTKKILGWFDSDSDNIPDILDVEANSILAPYSPDPTTDNTPTYTGSVSVVPFANKNSHSKYDPLHLTTNEPNENPDYTLYPWTANNITINTITNVQYRIKDATAVIVIDWTNATASDVAFDSSSENFTFTTVPLSSGTYSVEVRTINSVGVIETSYASDTLTINLQ